MPLQPDPILRIALFNVKYSPNLGDGILCECLEAEIRRAAPASAVVPLDLAGREDYGQGGRLRMRAMALLERSPAFARQRIVSTVLGGMLRTRLRPRWGRALREVEAVVVGGGNLFGDSDLNFPLKIEAALAAAREADLPVAVFGVGVSDNWSARGEALFRQALSGARLVHVALREHRSRLIWTKRLGVVGLPHAVLGHDPGLLIARHVPRRPAPARDRPLVGIGLTHPMALRYHSRRRFDDAEITAWFAALAQACTRRGWRVALFTNGSPEDEAYLRLAAPSIMGASPPGMVSRMARFARPAELAGFISGLTLLMAYRLHANITAYSYGIPHIGFEWDEKLTSFFALTRREAFLCASGVVPPEAVAVLGAAAMEQGIDPVHQGMILEAARQDVVDLVAALRASVGTRQEARRKATAPVEC